MSARRTSARQASARAPSPERLIEGAIAEAMTSADPVRALRHAGRDKRLPEHLRKALANVDEDGVRMAALLVARLRFERLVQGSVEASDWFHSDPAGFSAAFKRYHREVPPRAQFPPGEAKLFWAWAKPAPGARRK